MPPKVIVLSGIPAAHAGTPICNLMGQFEVKALTREQIIADIKTGLDAVDAPIALRRSILKGLE